MTVFQTNLWALNMVKERKVRFSKMVTETNQTTGTKAKQNGMSPSPEQKMGPKQRKKKNVNADETNSPSPEQMAKRRGAIVTDHERKKSASPVKIKVS